MHPMFAPAMAAALVAISATPAAAQVDNSAVAGPTVPSGPLEVRTGPLPAVLTLAQALEEADARSPALAAARADVEAARGRLRQARFRFNPVLNVEVENFAGTGPYTGFNGTETTVSVNQRLDIGGRRKARMTLGEAELAAQEYRFAIARANLGQQVRNLFALGVAARDNLALARENEARAREVSRVARALVEAGKEPPLRGLRADAALAQATAALRAAEAEEEAARRSLAALFGTDIPPAELVGSDLLPPPPIVSASQTLDVRLAEAERAIADAQLRQARAEGRLDPSVGVGVRQLRETGDRALVASLSVPLPLFDRNQGNVAAARSDIQAAEARRNSVLTNTQAAIANARAALDAADARVAALAGSAINQAREALRLAELSYRAGKSSLIELLDAQQAYSETQAELIAARRARAEAQATLERQAAAVGDMEAAQ
ncbi:TolC family protein [Altericroceibacterium spongiae]|uniref:Cobalt-zinc-cadmium efflux system outer membrane protein n=3 Tax=Sphingomonadales TaxID=204457 RepID=A0A4R6FAH0_9SPHN|nr:TolC family protein [Altericroceibacterium spongiae]RKF17348.1 TolC family protein [Altericroceibacterium spongiae]TDN77977.1 cobalt-zinc-cadmium efflux system outer membrane protein [Stakelama pacifica]GGP00490.1 metal transporter [Stakelama pacifica]